MCASRRHIATNFTLPLPYSGLTEAITPNIKGPLTRSGSILRDQSRSSRFSARDAFLGAAQNQGTRPYCSGSNPLGIVVGGSQLSTCNDSLGQRPQALDQARRADVFTGKPRPIIMPTDTALCRPLEDLAHCPGQVQSWSSGGSAIAKAIPHRDPRLPARLWFRYLRC
jgi:hypothetical protein